MSNSSKFLRYVVNELIIQAYRMRSIFMPSIYFVLALGCYIIVFGSRGGEILRPYEPMQILSTGSVLILFFEARNYINFRIKNGAFFADLAFPLSTIKKMLAHFFICYITNLAIIALLSIVFKAIFRTTGHKSGLMQIMEALPLITAAGMFFAILSRAKKASLAIGILLMLGYYCQILWVSTPNKEINEVIFWSSIGWTLSGLAIFSISWFVDYTTIV